MIDWDAVVHGPAAQVFGEPVTYTPLGGAASQIVAVFDEAYLPVDAGMQPAVISRRPVLGVQLSQMPVGFNPEAAQGDTFTVQRTGKAYTVKAGHDDGHGWAQLQATEA